MIIFGMWQTMTDARSPQLRLLLAAAAICAGLALGPGHAAAQINSSGRHTHYSVELEPHLVWQWTGDEAAVDDGVGIGFRASIPIMQDGPVPSLNNNLAITFGLDWAHFSDCWYGPNRDCGEDDFWIPITLQWNFFLTPVVSVFPEFGLGFRDAVFNYDNGFDCNRGRCRGSNLELRPVLWFGARFRVSDPVSIVVRLGTPSLQLGVSFFL
jgi:hypothetical protein